MYRADVFFIGASALVVVLSDIERCLAVFVCVWQLRMTFSRSQLVLCVSKRHLWENGSFLLEREKTATSRQHYAAYSCNRKLAH